MTEGTSLDDLLNTDPSGEPPEPGAQQEEPKGQPRGEDGKFVSTTGVEAEPQGEDAVPPTDKLPQEDYKAIREEREKRQNLERELEDLKTQIQTLQQPKEPPAPPPSIWEDEQGWQGHFQSQVVSQSALHSRVMMSEMLAAREHTDFAEMKAAYLQMERDNPALIPQVMNSPDPWGTAYKIAKNAQTMSELGATDMATLEAKMREKIMAEMQQGSTPVADKPLPVSLSGERSVASRSGPAWAGPTPLSDLLR